MEIKVDAWRHKNTIIHFTLDDDDVMAAITAFLIASGQLDIRSEGDISIASVTHD